MMNPLLCLILITFHIISASNSSIVSKKQYFWEHRGHLTQYQPSDGQNASLMELMYLRGKDFHVPFHLIYENLRRHHLISFDEFTKIPKVEAQAVMQKIETFLNIRQDWFMENMDSPEHSATISFILCMRYELSEAKSYLSVVQLDEFLGVLKAIMVIARKLMFFMMKIGSVNFVLCLQNVKSFLEKDFPTLLTRISKSNSGVVFKHAASMLSVIVESFRLFESVIGTSLLSKLDEVALIESSYLPLNNKFYPCEQDVIDPHRKQAVLKSPNPKPEDFVSYKFYAFPIRTDRALNYDFYFPDLPNLKAVKHCHIKIAVEAAKAHFSSLLPLVSSDFTMKHSLILAFNLMNILDLQLEKALADESINIWFYQFYVELIEIRNENYRFFKFGLPSYEGAAFANLLGMISRSFNYKTDGKLLSFRYVWALALQSYYSEVSNDAKHAALISYSIDTMLFVVQTCLESVMDKNAIGNFVSILDFTSKKIKPSKSCDMKDFTYSIPDEILIASRISGKRTVKLPPLTREHPTPIPSVSIESLKRSSASKALKDLCANPSLYEDDPEKILVYTLSNGERLALNSQSSIKLCRLFCSIQQDCSIKVQLSFQDLIDISSLFPKHQIIQLIDSYAFTIQNTLETRTKKMNTQISCSFLVDTPHIFLQVPRLRLIEFAGNLERVFGISSKSKFYVYSRPQERIPAPSNQNPIDIPKSSSSAIPIPEECSTSNIELISEENPDLLDSIVKSPIESFKNISLFHISQNGHRKCLLSKQTPILFSHEFKKKANDFSLSMQSSSLAHFYRWRFRVFNAEAVDYFISRLFAGDSSVTELNISDNFRLIDYKKLFSDLLDKVLRDLLTLLWEKFTKSTGHQAVMDVLNEPFGLSESFVPSKYFMAELKVIRDALLSMPRARNNEELFNSILIRVELMSRRVDVDFKSFATCLFGDLKRFENQLLTTVIAKVRNGSLKIPRKVSLEENQAFIEFASQRVIMGKIGQHLSTIMKTIPQYSDFLARRANGFLENWPKKEFHIYNPDFDPSGFLRFNLETFLIPKFIFSPMWIKPFKQSIFNHSSMRGLVVSYLSTMVPSTNVLKAENIYLFKTVQTFFSRIRVLSLDNTFISTANLKTDLISLILDVTPIFDSHVKKYLPFAIDFARFVNDLENDNSIVNLTQAFIFFNIILTGLKSSVPQVDLYEIDSLFEVLMLVNFMFLGSNMHKDEIDEADYSAYEAIRSNFKKNTHTAINFKGYQLQGRSNLGINFTHPSLETLTRNIYMEDSYDVSIESICDFDFQPCKIKNFSGNYVSLSKDSASSFCRFFKYMKIADTSYIVTTEDVDNILSVMAPDLKWTLCYPFKFINVKIEAFACFIFQIADEVTSLKMAASSTTLCRLSALLTLHNVHFHSKIIKLQ